MSGNIYHILIAKGIGTGPYGGGWRERWPVESRSSNDTAAR